MSEVEQFYECAPLPRPADPFAVRDAELRLVRSMQEAGYDPLPARVQVRAMLRQIAVGWGLALPAGAPMGPLPLDGIQVTEALELRRAHLAVPLSEYSYGSRVKWRDEDGRWVDAISGNFQDGGLSLWRGIDQPMALETNPARVQYA